MKMEIIHKKGRRLTITLSRHVIGGILLLIATLGLLHGL